MIAASWAVGLATGFLVFYSIEINEPDASSSQRAKASGYSEALKNQIDAVQKAISELSDNFADIALRMESVSSAERAPVASGASQEMLGGQVAALAEQVELLDKVVQSLQNAIKEGVGVARFPDLNLLNRFPAEQNWDLLHQLMAEWKSGREGEMLALSRVQWRSQEEILRLYGRPSVIMDNGNWLYERRDLNGRRWVSFHFVDNYVASLGTSSL